VPLHGDHHLIRGEDRQAPAIGDDQGECQYGRLGRRGEGRANNCRIVQRHRWAAGLRPAVGQRQVIVGVTAAAAIEADDRAHVHALV
jgi:hypothetical protein